MRFASGFLGTVFLAAGLPLLTGCGSGDGLDRESISGTVTLDGEPVPSGSITFTPENPSGPATAVEGVISAGAYKIATEIGPIPGAYAVRISSPQPAGSAPARKAQRGADSVSGTGAEETTAEPVLKEAIPERYNSRTDLKAEVAAGGANVFDYPLTSK